jgi:chitodextrinase
VPPAAPTNLSATAVSSTSVNLTWTASPGAVTSYRIYRGIVWVGSSATTSFPDTNLTPSTIYSYSVEAVGGNGLLSNQSVAASATTQAGSVAPTGTGTADPTPGLREAYAFPNPAKGVDPVIRAKLGLVDAVEITIFDAAGRAVHSATVDGGSATIVNGEYCYDYAWTGNKASGIYYAVIHGKAGGKVFKARAAFAVVR